METFLPSKLNQAEREKNSTKIFTFGPFAKALSAITYCA